MQVSEYPKLDKHVRVSISSIVQLKVDLNICAYVQENIYIINQEMPDIIL
jgi:hypothetical protein